MTETQTVRRADLGRFAELRLAPGRIYYAEIAHDDGCPSMRTRRIVDCRCEAVTVTVAEVR